MVMGIQLPLVFIFIYFYTTHFWHILTYFLINTLAAVLCIIYNNLLYTDGSRNA